MYLQTNHRNNLLQNHDLTIIAKATKTTLHHASLTVRRTQLKDSVYTTQKHIVLGYVYQLHT